MRMTLLAIYGLVLATQVGFEPNENVVVIRPTEMKTTTGATEPLTPGTTLTVQTVEADRLKVSAGRIGWLDSSVVIAADKADAHFSTLIEKNSKDAVALLARGKFRFDKGDHDAAIADLDQSLKLSANSEALTIRGFAWKRKGDKEKAMADFNEAIKLNPKEALAWRVRGATWAGKADYEKALADYSQSIRLDPENPDSLHHRAIMLSVCMEDKIRNGTKAVEDATKACEVSGWKNPLYLTGLAIANAEKGDFDAAVKWQTKAMELSTEGRAKAMQEQLEQFQMHKPLRRTWR